MNNAQYELVDNLYIDEPISLREARVICAIDDDYTEHDSVLSKHITASREYLEEQLNVGLAQRIVKVNWDGSILKLPLSPTGEIISVKSTKGTLLENEYSVSPYLAKTIFINKVAGNYNNVFYTTTGDVHFSGLGKIEFEEMYTVQYKTGYEQIPGNLWDALAMHINYLFQQRGTPGFNPANSGALSLAKGSSKNLTF